MKVKLDKNARMPTSAHKLDAGFDLYARETQTVPARGSAVFDTGVHVQIPAGVVGMVKSKSGLMMKGLKSEGVVDAGYTGSVCVKLFNNSKNDYTVNEGDKISQIVFMPIWKPTLEEVDELEETERGDNGFGSSGK